MILRAWTETDFAYAGTYFKFPEVTVVPRPFQRPCPPTWIAARTPDGLRFAAEHGIGVMMAPQRQPISRLQGQMRLLDAICEDLGVARPPVRITRGRRRPGCRRAGGPPRGSGLSVPTPRGPQLLRWARDRGTSG